MGNNKKFILFSRSALVSGAEVMLSRLAACLSNINGGGVECIISNVEVKDIGVDSGAVNFIYKRPLIKISKNPIFIFIHFFFGFFSFFKLFFIPRSCQIIFNDIESLARYWPLAVFRKSFFYLHDAHKLDGFKGRAICKFISTFSRTILVITQSRLDKLRGVGIVNTLYFPNCLGRKQEAVADVGVKKNRSVFDVVNAVAIGQIVSWKRIEKVIAVVSWLNSQGFNVRLRIFGRSGTNEQDLKYHSYIKDLCADAGFVELMGHVSDASCIYSEADVLISMSENEPFGLVLIEALSYGIPIISVNGEGPSEIVDTSVGVLLPTTEAYFDFNRVLQLSPAACVLKAERYSYVNYVDRAKQIFMKSF